jgi:ATP-dependent DNA helicase RecG
LGGVKCSIDIPRILRAIKQNGSPDLDFETDEDRNYFLVRFSIHPKSLLQTELSGFQNAPMGRGPMPVAGEATGEVTGEVTTSRSVVVNATLARRAATSTLNLKSQTNFRECYLDPALAGGWVDMTQPDSPQSPTQKYRLTDAGRRILGE